MTKRTKRWKWKFGSGGIGCFTKPSAERRWHIRITASPGLYTVPGRFLLLVCIWVCTFVVFHFSNIYSAVKKGAPLCLIVLQWWQKLLDSNPWRKSGLRRLTASTVCNEISTFPGRAQWACSVCRTGFYLQTFKAINRLFNPVFNVFIPEGSDAVKSDHSFTHRRFTSRLWQSPPQWNPLFWFLIFWS